MKKKGLAVCKKAHLPLGLPIYPPLYEPVHAPSRPVNAHSSRSLLASRFAV